MQWQETSIDLPADSFACVSSSSCLMACKKKKTYESQERGESEARE
jgi:hypothetical protein